MDLVFGGLGLICLILVLISGKAEGCLQPKKAVIAGAIFALTFSAFAIAAPSTPRTLGAVLEQLLWAFTAVVGGSVMGGIIYLIRAMFKTAGRIGQ